MKREEDDREIKKILTSGLLENAPNGLVDRIMANIAVSPARRLKTKPVEPNKNVAYVVLILVGVLIAVTVFLKPASMLSFSWEYNFNFTINSIWLVPALVLAMAVWGYIFISKNSKFKNTV